MEPNTHHNATQHKHHLDDQQHHTSHEHSGHDHASVFKKKLIVSAFLGVPILFLAPMMGITLPFQFAFPGSDWVVALLATALFIYGGAPFLQGAVGELKRKQPAMMTLIAMGISVSYGYSMYAFVMNSIVHHSIHIMDFFWELSSLILIMLLGHWIEMSAVSNAGNALKRLAELLPNDATLLNEDGTYEVHPLQHVQINDLVVVKAGEKVPVDGVVIEGSSLVNESMITGESVGIEKTLNSKVIGGSINGSGTLIVRVTGTGATGYLSQVMALVQQATQDKSRSESLADVVAKWLFYIALVVGIIAFIVWSIVSNVSVGVERLIAVLVIACPHALGLAIPLVTARSISLGAQNGVLVKSRQALEDAKRIDVLLMDKTGTLTEGTFEVIEVRSFVDHLTQEAILSLAASMEQTSSHPLAVGIVNYAKAHNVGTHIATDVTNIPGVGLSARVDGVDTMIVSVSYMHEHHIMYPKSEYSALAKEGYSLSFVLQNQQSIGWIAQGDRIKAESIPFVKTLKAMHIEPVMLTGDNRYAAETVGKRLGIDAVFAELMPHDKAQIVREYQEKGHRVMMVGDGVNDAPSLARADVGVAIGAGTDVAIDAADAILVNSYPKDILSLLRLSKATSRKMKENLLWGAGYNFIAIPLAAGLLAGVGFILSPAVGAILMSASTVIVALNAMRLNI